MFFDVFSAWKISFRELFSFIERCVFRAFWLQITFLFLTDLLVVMICCSRSCLLNENMKFSNLCCLFAKLAVTLESVAITFANSSCCFYNSVTWSFTWFNCNVNWLFKSSNLSFDISLYVFIWTWIMPLTNASGRTENSMNTCKSDFSLCPRCFEILLYNSLCSMIIWWETRISISN